MPGLTQLSWDSESCGRRNRKKGWMVRINSAQTVAFQPTLFELTAKGSSYNLPINGAASKPRKPQKSFFLINGFLDDHA